MDFSGIICIYIFPTSYEYFPAHPFRNWVSVVGQTVIPTVPHQPGLQVDLSHCHCRRFIMWGTIRPVATLVILMPERDVEDNDF